MRKKAHSRETALTGTFRTFLLAALLLFTALPASASLAIVQAKNGTGSSATAVTVTITSTAGNLLVFYVYEGVNNTSTLTVTDSTGGTNTWSQAGTYCTADTGSNLAEFFSTTTAGVTTVTGTWSGAISGTIPGVVYEISGAATSSPLDTNASNNACSVGSATGTSLTSGSLTTNNANDVILYGVGIGGNGTAWTASGSFAITSGGSISPGRMGVSQEIVSSTQSSLTTSLSWTTTQAHRTGIISAYVAAGTAAPTGVSKRQKLEQMDPPRRK